MIRYEKFGIFKIQNIHIEGSSSYSEFNPTSCCSTAHDHNNVMYRIGLYDSLSDAEKFIQSRGDDVQNYMVIPVFSYRS